MVDHGILKKNGKGTGFYYVFDCIGIAVCWSEQSVHWK